jgi:hypothetical protein
MVAAGKLVQEESEIPKLPGWEEQSMEQSRSVKNLIDFVVKSVQSACADDTPFHHLRLDRVFPDDFYMAMLQAMPVASDYRAMSGKSKVGSSRPDGKPTRTKIDLVPE